MGHPKRYRYLLAPTRLRLRHLLTRNQMARVRIRRLRLRPLLTRSQLVQMRIRKCQRIDHNSLHILCIYIFSLRQLTTRSQLSRIRIPFSTSSAGSHHHHNDSLRAHSNRSGSGGSKLRPVAYHQLRSIAQRHYVPYPTPRQHRTISIVD